MGDLTKNSPQSICIFNKITCQLQDLSKLKKVTIFVGTRELFYPDDTLLYRKIKQTGNSRVSLYVGKGLNHIFTVYPTLEGRIALEEICRIIIQ